MTDAPHADGDRAAPWSDTLRAHLDAARSPDARRAWARWEATALRELSRATLDDVSWALADGVSLPPFVDAAAHAVLPPDLERSAARGPLGRDPQRPWDIVCARDVLQVDPHEVAEARASWEHRMGVTRIRVDAAHVEATQLQLEPWRRALASSLASELHVGAWSSSLTAWSGDVIVDPVAAIVQVGGASDRLVSARAQALQSTPGGARPGLRLGVCARAVHEAGGDAVDELAVVLGQVAAWLRAGEQVGRAPADVVGALAVSVAIGREPFVEIAKLRAARAVIAALAEACGVTAERVDLRITGHSSARELTRRDPWVNLLRGTLVGIAGVLGGVDALEIAPLDALDAEHGAFGARMAIATHRLLRDEARLAVTADPTAGSYAIEAATEALARAAWQRFREIEAAGGFDAWLARGSLHALVEARARELAARVREGSLALLGSNLHPPKATHAVPKGEWTVPAPQPAGADPSTRGGGDIPPLPRLRLEDFTADASPIATVATTHGAA